MGYEAAIRDVRAQVEIAYYQLALDTNLGGSTQAQLNMLAQVLKVTEVAFETSRATPAEFIAAELARSTTEPQVQVYRLNVENDLTQLNSLLYRRPDEPLLVDEKLDLKPIGVPLDRFNRRGGADAAGESPSRPHREESLVTPKLSPKWNICRTIASPMRSMTIC